MVLRDQGCRPHPRSAIAVRQCTKSQLLELAECRDRQKRYQTK